MAVGAGFVKQGLRDERAGRIYDEMTAQKPHSTRDERLAARLRDNLRRRKTQARAFESVAETQGDSDDSPESGLSKSEG
jgi:hypothetical protein